eukprot:SM000270S10373  [mRNA]  locus=s270:149078:149795:- [translate_table: standard]
MAVTGGAGGDGGGGAAEYEHPCRCGDAYRLTGLDVAATVAGHEEDDQQRRQGQRQAQGGAGPEEAVQAEILVPCGSCSLQICPSARADSLLQTPSRAHDAVYLAGMPEDCLACTRPPMTPAKWQQMAHCQQRASPGQDEDDRELQPVVQKTESN